MLRLQLREDSAAIVEVEIQLPRDLRLVRQAGGWSPEKVAGRAILDTGADVTALDLEAATRAGLERSDTGELMTVVGHHDGDVS